MSNERKSESGEPKTPAGLPEPPPGFEWVDARQAWWDALREDMASGSYTDELRRRGFVK